METTMVYRDYIEIMEEKMETTMHNFKVESLHVDLQVAEMSV